MFPQFRQSTLTEHIQHGQGWFLQFPPGLVLYVFEEKHERLARPVLFDKIGKLFELVGRIIHSHIFGLLLSLRLWELGQGFLNSLANRLILIVSQRFNQRMSVMVHALLM